MLDGMVACIILRAMGGDTSRPASAAPTVASDERLDLAAAGIIARRGLLVVLSANFLGRTHVLAAGSTVIGRQSDCDFVLDDPLMSRRHCRVTVDGRGGFLLEDLSSTNATVLNSRPLRRPAALHYGDRIAAGGTIFRFLMEEEIPRK
jgi:pSer/pThr/pTyr-binding forkhead associated (FHA) protein